MKMHFIRGEMRITSNKLDNSLIAWLLPDDVTEKLGRILTTKLSGKPILPLPDSDLGY